MHTYMHTFKYIEMHTYYIHAYIEMQYKSSLKCIYMHKYIHKFKQEQSQSLTIMMD